MTNHLFQKIRDAVEGQEARLFLETPAGFALTYAGMITLSGHYAEALAELGLKPGDRVAAQVEKSVEALMLYLGAIRAGMIFLPLDTAYTSAELDYFLGDAQPKLLVCDPTRRDALAPVAVRAGLGAVATLGPDGRGGERARQISRTQIARQTISLRSFIRRGPPAARKARC